MSDDAPRPGLIDHLHLVVEDIAATRAFYRAVLGALRVSVQGEESGDHFWADELFVSSPDSRHAAGVLTGRIHLAFRAPDRASVEAFHRAGLAHGGIDNGAPGERPYHPGYYAAFLLDPAGNNIEAVVHDPVAATSPPSKASP